MLLAAIMLFSFQGLTVSATQNRDQYFSKSYTLTGNIRDDIVAVAAAQNGKTKAQLGFTEAWCANFVCGCAALAGIPNFPRNGSCDQLIVLLKKWGGAWYAYNSDYIPKKGDIVFFSSKGNTSDDSTHVGIIYQDGFVASKTVKTVEGNTSGVTSSCVNIKNRAVYGSPADNGLHIVDRRGERLEHEHRSRRLYRSDENAVLCFRLAYERL